MRRSGIAIIAALAFVPGSAHGDNPVLTAIVGTNDGFDITLNDARGQKVAFIPPGAYTVVVQDRSRIHNFHLASNDDTTVDFRTEIEFVGEQTFTVTFRNNTRYAYACEPHWQTMNGSFFVRPTTEPPPPPPPAPLRTLRASVSATGAVRVSASRVRAGRYRIVVTDRSRRANFHLLGRGVNKRTGMRFTGSQVWRVRLARGVYRYGSDRAGLAKRLRVT
jgi:Copper binding proteins, plastocyanin/azurin family